MNGFATTLTQAESALLARWSESRPRPSLDRIAALVATLGNPQAALPAVHVTGTNGKTSAARIVEQLLRASARRVGRFTSPHLVSVLERICLDGVPIADAEFVDSYNRVARAAVAVDAVSEHPLSFFEMTVAMAFDAFRRTRVDAVVVEVGMGGAWDATNVVDADVCVVTPVALDHAEFLGATPVEIAREKAGIIKPGAIVVSAVQAPDVHAVLRTRCASVGATLCTEGTDFEVVRRAARDSGQVLELRGLDDLRVEVFLPLHGRHQAQNAVLALAATQAFLGSDVDVDEATILAGFHAVTSPGRLELIPGSPQTIVDAAHNPHGAAAVAAAIREMPALQPLVGVLAVMSDKDYGGILRELEPVLSRIICTTNGSERGLPADALARAARTIYGPGRVVALESLELALTTAAELAVDAGGRRGGVLVAGSVVTAGRARALLAGGGVSPAGV